MRVARHARKSTTSSISSRSVTRNRHLGSRSLNHIVIFPSTLMSETSMSNEERFVVIVKLTLSGLLAFGSIMVCTAIAIIVSGTNYALSFDPNYTNDPFLYDMTTLAWLVLILVPALGGILPAL